MVGLQEPLAKMGKIVKKNRLEKDMTQEELAFSAETCASVISKLECGHTENIGVRTVQKIATALGVSELALLVPVDYSSMQMLNALQKQVETLWAELKEAPIPPASDTQYNMNEKLLDILVQIHGLLKLWLDP